MSHCGVEGATTTIFVIIFQVYKALCGINVFFREPNGVNLSVESV
jgi:hypothetical protein